MAHGAIYGISENGKSYFAKQLSKILVEDYGMNVCVVDPSAYDADGWTCHEFFNDRKSFKQFFWANTDFVYFVDEAGDIFNDKDKPMTTRGRHLGNSVIFNAQRGEMLPKTLRSMATWMVCFQMEDDDAISYSKAFKCPELRQTAEFEPYHYVYTRKGGRDTIVCSGQGKKAKENLAFIAESIFERHSEPSKNVVKLLHGKAGYVNWERMVKDGLIEEEYVPHD